MCNKLTTGLLQKMNAPDTSPWYSHKIALWGILGAFRGKNGGCHNNVVRRLFFHNAPRCTRCRLGCGQIGVGVGTNVIPFDSAKCSNGRHFLHAVGL